MSNRELWKNFLENIKEVISSTSFDIWFNENDTKLYSFKNDIATITVPQEYHKKHLEDHYMDNMNMAMRKAANTDVTINIILDSEIASLEEEKKQLKLADDVHQSSDNANLNPNYTFESFIVGNSNKFAFKAARVVAESPGTYNPLFLYGESGVGKTHLMHSIGNYLIENTDKKVLYIASDKFVDEYTRIFRNNEKSNFDKIDAFKDKYRNVDVLMIDDIQFLEIAQKTQQEFFNTFNDLYTNNKQIIIASDRSPDDLKKLEERLRTRFVWGLIVDILPPDYQLRMNIIDKKIDCNNMNTFFPQEVKEYIANNCTSDIRKLEGAITRVVAYSAIMNGSDITLELAMDALKDYFGVRLIAKNKIEQVQNVIAHNYNIKVEDLKSKRKSNDIAIPRQIAMYICRIYLKESLPKIGAEFGGKDHTTVMHAVNKIKKEVDTNDQLNIEINKIIHQLPWINE